MEYFFSSFKVRKNLLKRNFERDFLLTIKNKIPYAPIGRRREPSQCLNSFRYTIFHNYISAGSLRAKIIYRYSSLRSPRVVGQSRVHQIYQNDIINFFKKIIASFCNGDERIGPLSIILFARGFN